MKIISVKQESRCNKTQLAVCLAVAKNDFYQTDGIYVVPWTGVTAPGAQGAHSTLVRVANIAVVIHNWYTLTQ